MRVQRLALQWRDAGGAGDGGGLRVVGGDFGARLLGGLGVGFDLVRTSPETASRESPDGL
jgi:hypothetical protein